MKVGILTWFFGANYGAKLHSYALYNVLKERGYEPVFISFYPSGYKKLNYKMNLNCQHYRRHPIRYFNCRKRVRKFDVFSSSWDQTPVVYNGHDIDQLGLDAVICGSDAIFNLSHPLFSQVYFGVGINETKKISYAPCCENTPVNSKFTKEIVDSLNGFYALSARDEYTRELLENNAERSVEIVLDPTFLFDFSTDASSKKFGKYILLYTFSDWSQYRLQITAYAEKMCLKIVSIGRYYSWADYSLDAATVEEWLSAFKYADCVFTDSFHGLCFSIKNNKQFVVTGREDKVEKNRALMTQLGIEKTFYTGEDFEKAMQQKIDYEKVNGILAIQRDKSIRYLTSNL